MYRLLLESRATPEGPSNSVVPAPAVPFPITVVITPLATFRMTLLPVSAMYRLPAVSRARPDGPSSAALTGSPPSP
jgi:hypothetical protein